MAVTLNHDDIQEIKKVLDERYVRISDCDEKQKTMNSKLANDDKRIALLIHQQSINNWLTGAIASGIVALLIKVYLGG